MKTLSMIAVLATTLFAPARALELSEEYRTGSAYAAASLKASYAAAQSRGAASGLRGFDASASRPNAMNELAQLGLRKEAEDKAQAVCEQQRQMNCRVSSRILSCDHTGCFADAKAEPSLVLPGEQWISTGGEARDAGRGALTDLEMLGLRKMAEEDAVAKCRQRGYAACGATRSTIISCGRSGRARCVASGTATGLCASKTSSGGC